jgi:hypothetical protein
MKIGDDEFEVTHSLIDVTSLHRPDTRWKFVDKQGHEHRWFADNKPVTTYSPSQRYETPTLRRIVTGTGYWEDGESYVIAHLECVQCGEEIEPGYCADEDQQFIPGLKRCYINGQSVTREEFERRLAEKGIKM